MTRRGTRALLAAPLLLAAGCATPRATARLTNPSFEKLVADGLPGWQGRLGDGVSVDGAQARSGQASLRVAGGGRGLLSDLVPYAGGRVRVAGWMKTQDVRRGERSWHRAALQLIPHDASRKPVGHTDVALVEGTTDWTRHEKTAILSRDVAFVAIRCHLWGDETTGTAWFDDVSIELLDDPATLDRKPVDLAKATVTVDLGRDLGEFRHLWLGSDVGWMDRVVTPTQINAMREAKQAGFSHIRLHDCIFNPRIYAEDADGKPVYRWETFDERIQTVLDTGMLPIVVLETMPPEIAGRRGPKGWTNAFPPKGREGYLKWQRLCRDLVAHCKERWPEDSDDIATWGRGVEDWYFEVWNEPDAKAYFDGTLEDYLRIYDHAVAGAVAAEPTIRIGGPGGADTGWIEPFLQHCAAGRNDATGETGCRADFVSWHIYTVGVGIPAFDKLRVSLDTVRRAREAIPAFRNLPMLITEWGCASSRFAGHDRPYDAAFRAMAVRAFLDYGITFAPPFCLGEGPQHCHEGFQGGLALFTKTTIPKPSFRAFQLLGRMTGRRVACESSNAPVGGVASFALSRESANVLLYNLVENPAHPPYETAVTVRLRGLPAGAWRCEATAIAPGGCDPFVAWERMGRPETLTAAQRTALVEASRLPRPTPVAVEDGCVRVQMPGLSVMLLALSR